MCVTVAWRYGAADPLTAMSANTRDFMSSHRVPEEVVEDRTSIKEFDEV